MSLFAPPALRFIGIATTGNRLAYVHPNIEKVRAALLERGFHADPVELPTSTRTAQEAADATGASVGQIVKTLVFMAGSNPLLVLASGSNRVSIEKLAALAGEEVKRADADTVKQATGFSIGGVPPVGHPRLLRVLIDPDLLGYSEVWAAAGTSNAVFPIKPEELVRVTGGEVVNIRED